MLRYTLSTVGNLDEQRATKVVGSGISGNKELLKEESGF